MTAAELARPRRLDTLGDGDVAVAIEADAAERGALAARFGLPAIGALNAEQIGRASCRERV